MVTSSAPHKNATGGIEGYARYVQRAGSAARPIKIVGLSRERDAYQRKIAQLGLSHVISVEGFVTESHLRSLYNGAAALLFPSFAEGFGIPVLEAMATGTPVIAANTTSLPEVGGDAARYFDPTDPEAIAHALEAVLSDDLLRQHMAQRGLLRAEHYHPTIVGPQVIAFWEEVAGVHASRNVISSPSRKSAATAVS
jgi:glycosyltransferase involved in cell wall biosynthesis